MKKETKRQVTIEFDDVEDMEERHRAAMLDLILSWGSLDGALGMLLSRAEGLPLDEGAEVFGRQPGSAKLTELRRLLLKSPGGSDAAAKGKKFKKDYEHYSFYRNLVAHSHCAGIWKLDRDFIVFASFEKFAVGHLGINAVPISNMEMATRWGDNMKALAIKLGDAAIQ